MIRANEQNRRGDNLMETMDGLLCFFFLAEVIVAKIEILFQMLLIDHRVMVLLIK